jgi:hypothetical protein
MFARTFVLMNSVLGLFFILVIPNHAKKPNMIKDKLVLEQLVSICVCVCVCV